ncbi:response regulator transcription factor [Mesoaciditoga lauensis]|uniref:response regulator transcription factor n=1 Tax=Mesoaciditoga lauensis TaxID=1495039 RepID=UPI000562910D|nr:response regulator transcription factor [Mesoaciditoga lauensis]
MKNVLLVEDEEDMIEIISYILKTNAFDVTAVQDLSHMWNELSKKTFDVILLDVGLPDGSGMDALKVLKEKNVKSAVIMVTARRTDMDKILGLELGADDYITKPFNSYELLARIKAVIRRTKASNEEEKIGLDDSQNVFRFGKKVIKMDSYTAIDENGNEIDFAGKEFDLLKLFITHPSKVFTREEILDRIWGKDFFGEFRTVDVHVSKIRKKLGDKIIKTVRGVGYKLGESDG